MSTRLRRQKPTASHPKSARQRELTTKRRGELAELAFTLKAASLGFGVSKPFGDSERYDFTLDSRELSSHSRCQPSCPIMQAAQNRKASKKCGAGASPAKSSGKGRVPHPFAPFAKGWDSQTPEAAPFSCPALRVLNPTSAPHPWCPPHPTSPFWRVQVKCSTQLDNGLYHLNAHRRTGGRAVPYLPGEIDFLAAYIIPEDTWYILPLEAFLGSTSLLFRRRNDPKPGLYDQYKEAWHLLRPN